jgi:hypothetical protein
MESTEMGSTERGKEDEMNYGSDPLNRHSSS